MGQPPNSQQHLNTALLKFPKGEQACLNFRHNYIELKRQILIGEQLSKMSAFFEEKCQAEIDFIDAMSGL